MHNDIICVYILSIIIFNVLNLDTLFSYICNNIQFNENEFEWRKKNNTTSCKGIDAQRVNIKIVKREEQQQQQKKTAETILFSIR